MDAVLANLELAFHARGATRRPRGLPRLARWLLVFPVAMILPRHILVATDFGPASERAIDFAIELARRFGAKLTVLHVLEPAIFPYASGVPFAPPLEVLNGCRAAMCRLLDRTRETVLKRYTRAQCILRDGRPSREIIATAKELLVDLVVVGSHGRRGLPRQLLGSVAERVVRLSPVPVLTAHGFWFEDRRHAGRALAAELAPLCGHEPLVVAISRGGIAVGAEVARALGASLDVLLTGRIEIRGILVGAVCEGGVTVFAPEGIERGGVAEQQEKILSATREQVEQDAQRLRSGAGVGDLWRRTVILVSDAFMDVWRPFAAADALAKMDPDRVVFAAPVASEAVLSSMKDRFPEVVVLHTLYGCAEPSAAYRRFQSPSDRALIECLRRSSPVRRLATSDPSPTRG